MQLSLLTHHYLTKIFGNDLAWGLYKFFTEVDMDQFNIDCVRRLYISVANQLNKWLFENVNLVYHIYIDDMTRKNMHNSLLNILLYIFTVTSKFNVQ